MTKTWGATPEEWRLFRKKAAKDLLPVVSNPSAPIAADSTMRILGKTPSRYNDRGEVVGIGKWTQYSAHPEEIKLWSKEKDYGICLQTRRVRAFDIDVEDPQKAQDIVQFIEEWFEKPQALRTRENSGKCLIAFILEGEYGKRTVKTQGGMIEFLANGQQFIAAGTHPSGVRYAWSSTDFYEISEDQFENLWFALCEEFGTEAPTQRGLRRFDADISEDLDATGRYLIDSALVHANGNSGQLFIECPFAEGHSTESNGTDTAYFPAGTGGYEQGHFVCLHASCAKRTDRDFMKALGVYDSEFEVILLGEEPEKNKELPAWARDKHGQPEATLYNLRLALERSDICNYTPRYDTFRDEVIYCDCAGNWFPESDEIPIELRMRLETVYQFREIAKEKMRDAIWYVAKRNRTDTAQDWLNSLEWDGEHRIEYFFSRYIGCKDTPYTRAVSLYLWTGLAGRILEPGLKADMIPVIQSPEGYRKSSAIEAIAPTPEQFVELDFSEKDADLARKMRGALVGEIAELRGLRTRELEGILAWCSRRFEKWIPKFKEYSSTFPRRLMFVATTNEEEFLDGARKHRRWLPLTAKDLADTASIVKDRAYLWAEAREVFLRNGLHYEKADTLAKKHRERYRIKDLWEEVIQDWLRTPDSLDGHKPEDAEFVTLLDVARFALNLDPKNLKRLDEKKISDCLRVLGLEPARRYVDGVQARVWVKKDADLA